MLTRETGDLSSNDMDEVWYLALYAQAVSHPSYWCDQQNLSRSD